MPSFNLGARPGEPQQHEEDARVVVVGRGLTNHYLDLVIGVLPYDAGTTKGTGSSARADFPGRGSLEHAGGLGPGFTTTLMAASQGGTSRFYGHSSSRRGADTVGRLVGNELKTVFADTDRLVAIFPLVDDHVEAANRVSVSNQFPSDEHGPVPKVEVLYQRRARRTLENREFLVRQAVRIARAAGATSVHRIDLPELVVHSALANSVGGPNPTLTTQALATRTAERVFRNFFDGDPWVGVEAPLSSVDDAVTNAVLALDGVR